MSDNDLIVVSLGTIFLLGSLFFCCHYWQLYGLVRMYQTNQEQRIQYIVLPSAPLEEA